MMRRVLLLALTLTCLSWPAVDVLAAPSPEVLARIQDDDPNPLPKHLTEAEKRLPLQGPTRGDFLQRTPPLGEVHCPAEYEPSQGLLMRWGSYNSVLTELIVGLTTQDPEAITYLLVTGSSQQASATSTLSGAGADLSQVEFITYSANTVWIRDYGPRYIFEDGNRAIVDHTYNRPRPLDNAFPDYLSILWGEPHYDIPLTHGGGNFHLFTNRDAFMSDLILNENPGLSEQDVIDLYYEYQNLELTIYPRFPSYIDSTGHIDMWMMPLKDDTVVISEWASGPAYTITEDATADLQARGYTVHRVPAWNSGGTHYTYTNAVIINDLLFVSNFGGSYVTEDLQVQAIYQAAMPNLQIIPVYSGSIIQASGAIHCVVMHVPAYPEPIPVVTVYEPNGSESWTIGEEYDITWEATDDVGVTYINIYYSTDGGIAWPNVIALAEPNDGVYSWVVPDNASDQCRVKVVAYDAELNVGEDTSDADFTISDTGLRRRHDFSLDTDPGWATEGQWAWGQPTGGGSHDKDPSSGHTGSAAYGYNLSGDYANNMPVYNLTTTAFDCSNVTSAELRFRRWLGVEQTPNDSVTLMASNDDTNWVSVWRHAGSAISESRWTLQAYDISAVADEQATVYLRWGMGPTNGSMTYPGWNIDDVEIWGVVPDPCGGFVFTPGDVNDDGSVDGLDVQPFVIVLLAGTGVPDDLESCAADVDGSGEVNLADIDALVQLLLGL